MSSAYVVASGAAIGDHHCHRHTSSLTALSFLLFSSPIFTGRLLRLLHSRRQFQNPNPKVWVAYKESSWISAFIWIVLLICFGSITTCAYIVRQLFYLSSQDPVCLVLLNGSNR